MLTSLISFFAVNSQSPCIPNSGITYPDGWGISPDTNEALPEGTVGFNYSKTFYFRTPEECGDVDGIDCQGFTKFKDQ